jgi:hypothetical protein
MDKPILKVIAENPALIEALKTELTDAFLSLNIQTDGGYSDTQLGQMYRARIVGLSVVEDVFKKIAKYRPRTEVVRGMNAAR